MNRSVVALDGGEVRRGLAVGPYHFKVLMPEAASSADCSADQDQ